MNTTGTMAGVTPFKTGNSCETVRSEQPQLEKHRSGLLQLGRIEEEKFIKQPPNGDAHKALPWVSN